MKRVLQISALILANVPLAAIATIIALALWGLPKQQFVCAVHMMKLSLLQTTYEFRDMNFATKRCITELNGGRS